MALALKFKEGEDVYIGDEHFTLVRIVDETVRFQHTKSMKIYTLREDMAHEVLPDVFVSLGAITQPGSVRLAFDAPKEIRVFRGDMYRERLPAGV